MQKRMSTIYAVHKGHCPGIYLDWKEAEKQIEGFENAIYKSFRNIKKARQFVQQGPVKKEKKKKQTQWKQDTYFHVASPFSDQIDTEKDPLVVTLQSQVETTPTGIPLGGYTILFDDAADKRNVKEKFPLPNHTLQRCEIMAAKRAIEIIKEKNYADQSTELIIATTSIYLFKNIQRSTFPNKNKGLFESLYAASQTRPVSFMLIVDEK